MLVYSSTPSQHPNALSALNIAIVNQLLQRTTQGTRYVYTSVLEVWHMTIRCTGFKYGYKL
jgi:sulfur relay (sulfurtransferase) DsrF/TusC family protein